MDIEGEVNVTEQWRNWFLIGVILGLVNILVKISSFWPWFCKTKGANGVEPDEKKVFVMLIPRCLIGMILTTWIIFGTVYRFSDEVRNHLPKLEWYQLYNLVKEGKELAASSKEQA